LRSLLSCRGVPCATEDPPSQTTLAPPPLNPLVHQHPRRTHCTQHTPRLAPAQTDTPRQHPQQQQQQQPPTTTPLHPPGALGASGPVACSASSRNLTLNPPRNSTGGSLPLCSNLGHASPSHRSCSRPTHRPGPPPLVAHNTHLVGRAMACPSAATAPDRRQARAAYARRSAGRRRAMQSTSWSSRGMSSRRCARRSRHRCCCRRLRRPKESVDMKADILSVVVLPWRAWSTRAAWSLGSGAHPRPPRTLAPGVDHESNIGAFNACRGALVA
jgi:hypothetical protein